MQPLWADFNACDNDGAVLMGAPPFLDMHPQETDFVPTDGANVLISDGEIELTGTLAFRDNKYWVTIPVEGSTKKVPKDAWYHNDNLNKST